MLVLKKNPSRDRVKKCVNFSLKNFNQWQQQHQSVSLISYSSPSMWYLRGVAVHKHPVHYCRHIYGIPCIFICKYSTSKTFLFTAEHDIPRASSLMVQILQYQLIPCFRSRLNFLLKFSEKLPSDSFENKYQHVCSRK